MPAALMLLQVIAWRLSIEVWSEYQRSCVFRPSVNRMMICEYLYFGSIAGGVG
jgi:hypothetical protein